MIRINFLRINPLYKSQLCFVRIYGEAVAGILSKNNSLSLSFSYTSTLLFLDHIITQYITVLSDEIRLPKRIKADIDHAFTVDIYLIENLLDVHSQIFHEKEFCINQENSQGWIVYLRLVDFLSFILSWGGPGKSLQVEIKRFYYCFFGEKHKTCSFDRFLSYITSDFIRLNTYINILFYELCNSEIMDFITDVNLGEYKFRFSFPTGLEVVTLDLLKLLRSFRKLGLRKTIIIKFSQPINSIFKETQYFFSLKLLNNLEIHDLFHTITIPNFIFSQRKSLPLVQRRKLLQLHDFFNNRHYFQFHVNTNVYLDDYYFSSLRLLKILPISDYLNALNKLNSELVEGTEQPQVKSIIYVNEYIARLAFLHSILSSE